MKFFVYILYFIFFIGCVPKKTTPVFVTIKSSQIKISDAGFLEEGSGYKKLVIYKVGAKPIEIIVKNNVICLKNKCINKYLFFKKYLGIEDKHFFDTILEKKAFKNVEVKKIRNGFVQGGKFFYKVTQDAVLFKKKNFLIFIKFLKKEKK